MKLFKSHDSQPVQFNIPPSTAGFTLIEVMIALVILVVGVLGVLYMQLASTKGNSNAIAITRSVQEMSASLDQLAGVSYTDASLTPGTNKTATDLFSDSKLTNNLQSDFSYDVVDISDINTELNLKEIFKGVDAKKVTVESTQVVGGQTKALKFYYLKFSL